MADEKNNNSGKQGKNSSKTTIKAIEGKALNLSRERRQPATVPPKMELKPPKK